MTAPIAGLHVPLVTPFDGDGTVDLDALRRLAARVLDDGADGLVALGTTGEAVALREVERAAVVDCCAEACAARGRPLTVGVGGGDTASAAREVAWVGARDGVGAVMAVVPPYVRPAQEGIAAHFRALGDASPLPLLVYDNPPRTGVRLGSETLLRLAAVEPRIAGVKLSVPVVDGDVLALLAGAPDGFAVLTGEDALVFPMMALGAAGAISAAAHCATPRFAALMRAARAAGGDGVADAGGSLAEARSHHTALLPLVRALFAEPNPTVVKGVLARTGELSSAAVRLPHVPASMAVVDAAVAVLAALEPAAVAG
jgi:4-hydroxy-tetrahydrodipicolinate synthase